MDKLRLSTTEWLAISDKELEQEYRRKNDKVKLAHDRVRNLRDARK